MLRVVVDWVGQFLVFRWGFIVRQHVNQSRKKPAKRRLRLLRLDFCAYLFILGVLRRLVVLLSVCCGLSLGGWGGSLLFDGVSSCGSTSINRAKNPQKDACGCCVRIFCAYLFILGILRRWVFLLSVCCGLSLVGWGGSFLFDEGFIVR